MTWSTSSTPGMRRCSAGWERIPAVRLNIWWKDWIQRRSATWCWNDMFSLFRSEHIFLVFSITQVLHKIPMKQYTQSHLFISVICIFTREMETFWIELINWWCAAYTALSSFWTLMCIISKLNIVLCYLRQATALIHLYTVGLVRLSIHLLLCTISGSFAASSSLVWSQCWWFISVLQNNSNQTHSAPAK